MYIGLHVNYSLFLSDLNQIRIFSIKRLSDPTTGPVWSRGWVELQLYSSMTAALEGVSGEQHAPAALYLRERPGTHFTGGWVGPRAGPNGRKISSPPGFDPGPSSPQSVAIPTDLPGPLEFSQHMFQKYSDIKFYGNPSRGSTVLPCGSKNRRTVRHYEATVAFPSFVNAPSKHIPPPMTPHVLCGIRGPPSWIWQECNRLLRVGRP